MKSRTRLGEKTATRENNFDFMRFVAASQVILFHTFALTGRFSGTLYNAYHFIVREHSIGVSTFFVISGFLITKSRLESRGFLSYMKKRFLRLVPALTVSVLFGLLLVGPLTSPLSLGEYFSGLINGLLSFQPQLMKALKVVDKAPAANVLNAPLWTLYVEGVAYLVIAFAGFLSLKRLKLFIVVCFALLMTVNVLVGGRHDFYDLMAGPLYVWLSFRYLSLFAAGSLIYLYRDRIPLDRNAFLLLLLAMLLAQRARWFTLSYLILPYLVIYFAYSAVPLRNWGKFGDFSYGLYIFAFPVQQTILNFWAGRINNIQFFLLAFSCTFCLAWLSWNLVEKPALRLKGDAKKQA